MKLGWDEETGLPWTDATGRFRYSEIGERSEDEWHGALVLLQSGLVTFDQNAAKAQRQGTCLWLAREDRGQFFLSDDARGIVTMVRFPSGRRYTTGSRILVATPLLYAVMDRLAELEIDACPVRASYEDVALEEMLRDLDAADTAQIPRSTNLQLWAIGFMENPRVTTTKEEAAQATRMSVRSFTRHFKQETGEGFRSWKTRALTTKAKSLLYYGKTVSEVSGELAYESVGSFISMFKEATGKTPGDYSREPKVWSERASQTAVTKAKPEP